MTRRTLAVRSQGLSVFWLLGSLKRWHAEKPGIEDIKTTCHFCYSWLCSSLLVACQKPISRKPKQDITFHQIHIHSEAKHLTWWHRSVTVSRISMLAWWPHQRLPSCLKCPGNKMVTQLNLISLIPLENPSSSGNSHIDKKILSRWTYLLTIAVTPALTTDLIWIFKSIVDHKFKWFSYPLKALFS